MSGGQKTIVRVSRDRAGGFFGVFVGPVYAGVTLSNHWLRLRLGPWELRRAAGTHVLRVLWLWVVW